MRHKNTSKTDVQQKKKQMFRKRKIIDSKKQHPFRKAHYSMNDIMLDKELHRATANLA